MKKFLKSITIFSLSIIGIYIILIIVWGEIAPDILKKNMNYRIGSKGHMYSRIQELRETKNIDILFLGSSHSYRGFDTRIFSGNGYKSFNLGSSSQTHIQSNILLKRYIDQLNPKLVIYEVNPEMFTIDGVEASLDLIANDDNYSYLTETALKQNNIKVYNTLIFGFYQKLFNRNNNFIENPIKGEDTYIKGGFVEKELSYFSADSCFKQKEYEFRDEQFLMFEENINILKALNINVMLVQAPINSKLYNSYSNIASFNDTIKSYGEYYNFNNLMQLDDSLHFYDEYHLNQIGVKKFNYKLIDILKEKHKNQ